MDNASVMQVRSFNRTVTQRIGALYEEYLGRSRPLGASRVLWELDDEGTDARSLRVRLDLDSGYLSRLLRSLERDGLVTVTVDPEDNRVRTVRLTDAGQAERALLDRHSNELAWSLLEPLSASQRTRLADAMGVVDRLLTASMIDVGVEEPTTPAAQMCIRSYFAELNSRFPTGFDPQHSISADAEELTLPAGLLLLARLRDEPVGCGALKLHGTGPAEVKRMWVAASARGVGVGRRILEELERAARQRGVRVLRLETNRSLTEAISLYRSAGYVEVDPFNDEPYAHYWFEKRLTEQPAGHEG
jgi:DNA-binding MarR family transcriptional regulator/GNAT superfamily N-acetyltransferase